MMQTILSGAPTFARPLFGLGTLALLFLLSPTNLRAAPTKNVVKKEVAETKVLALTPYEKIDAMSAKEEWASAEKEVAPLVAEGSKDFDALWRASRISVFLGDRSPSKSDPQKSAYERGLSYADRAIEVAPDKAMGYVRKAIAEGNLALFKGVLDARESVLAVRAACEKAIELKDAAPATTALAHYVFGRAHLKLTETPVVIRKPIGLGFGSLAGAEGHFKKAVELVPSSIRYKVDYAKALIKLDRPSEAKIQLEAATQIAAHEPDDEKFLTEAKALISRL